MLFLIVAVIAAVVGSLVTLAASGNFNKGTGNVIQPVEKTNTVTGQAVANACNNGVCDAGETCEWNGALNRQMLCNGLQTQIPSGMTCNACAVTAATPSGNSGPSIVGLSTGSNSLLMSPAISSSSNSGGFFVNTDTTRTSEAVRPLYYSIDIDQRSYRTSVGARDSNISFYNLKPSGADSSGFVSVETPGTFTVNTRGGVVFNKYQPSGGDQALSLMLKSLPASTTSTTKYYLCIDSTDRVYKSTTPCV